MFHPLLPLDANRCHVIPSEQLTLFQEDIWEQLGALSAELAASSSVWVVSSSHPPRDRSKRGNVTFWHKRQWLDFFGNNSGDSGSDDAYKERKIVRKFQFLQDENGNLISPERLDEMRRFAREIFAEMASRKTAPLHWESNVLANERSDFCRRMENAFPELRLCENSWKANEVAILIYPGWKSNRLAYFHAVAEAT
ncbi:uncharacterized protein PHACADRAFT_263802 [Phanerochaete carnosa HHB-10118-sp]|uniref:Uncharacterized protein n=1 Tax=Phanerochaete carnosa (strain HHB-10118-sp) TaxID=650164 RepID=K5VUJ9_PHACS|nr:uncharacterized protein PHACADRAFT_263802 [Phanerochaete carnosa HHB-10118-sp]EKM50480.1 hypothetical protein PHACADRAFT_263802 [Phanerochaete carnosa HHB-10118-sp]